MRPSPVPAATKKPSESVAKDSADFKLAQKDLALASPSLSGSCILKPGLSGVLPACTSHANASHGSWMHELHIGIFLGVKKRGKVRRSEVQEFRVLFDPVLAGCDQELAETR